MIKKTLLKLVIIECIFIHNYILTISRTAVLDFLKKNF